jgi:hypothetical protein
MEFLNDEYLAVPKPFILLIMRPDEQAQILINSRDAYTILTNLFSTVVTTVLEIDFETNQIPTDEGHCMYAEFLKLHQQARES